MNINETGLKDEEVIEQRKKYGTNDINYKKKNSFLSLLVESLGDPIIKILLIALGIKIVFLFKSFDWYETLGIIIAIFVASFISSISEYGSEKAFAKLQQDFLKTKSKVKRNNQLLEIPSSEVVVKDLVVLSSGDKIPADGYLISGELTVDESALNGESGEVYKYAINRLSNNIIDENRVYRGTSVYSREAIMVVEKVGTNTLYGKIAEELCDDSGDSPLKIKLRGLAKVISRIGYIGAFLVSFSYLFSVIVIDNHFDMQLIIETITSVPLIFDYLIYALTLCVTIIVVAVPEGLPMMITLVLSSNMKRMLKNNVLVRKLVGIETAGSLNILFTDKTGTLTTGNLELSGIMDANGNTYNSELELREHPKYHEIVRRNAVVNNSSKINANQEIVGGNSTDRALIKFFSTSGVWDYQKLKHIPFDSKKKYAVTMIGDEFKTKLIKGTPELILKNCKYYIDTSGNKKRLLNLERLDKKIKEYTDQGVRVLMLAQSTNANMEDFNDLTYVATLIIGDTIRKEAKEGVKLVQGAGVQTVMMTGDNKNTAFAIAKEVGIITSDDDIAITSQELNEMTDEEVVRILPKLKLIARSLPQDKSRLVRIAQSENLVVGMTGDGVNDAPALKRADVGFAMGSGTEVAKEASDIVILDNNFLSISKAILFGRTIFKSIRKFIIVQLTINMCAIGLSVVCPFIGIDTPVTIIQMLWVNMVMDTLAGLAFAYEPPLIEYMKEKPKKKTEPIINKYMYSQIIISGVYAATLCLVFLKSEFIIRLFRNDYDYLMTAFFGLFIFVDIFNSFNARTTRINIFANITKNMTFIIIMIFIVSVQVLLIYKGGKLFRTTGLELNEFIIMLLFALTVIPVDWIRKKIVKIMWPNASI